MFVLTPWRPGPSVALESLEHLVAVAIAESKERCRVEILASAPEHKQANAALGILSEEEVAAIRAHIVACRDRQNAYEAAVLAIAADATLDDQAKADAIAALVYGSTSETGARPRARASRLGRPSVEGRPFLLRAGSPSAENTPPPSR